MKKRSRRGTRLMQSMGAIADNQGHLSLSIFWPYRNRMSTAYWFGFIKCANDRSVVWTRRVH